MSKFLAMMTPRYLLSLVIFTAIAVAAVSSVIIHAVQGTALDETTITLLSFLMGGALSVLGNSTTSPTPGPLGNGATVGHFIGTTPPHEE